MYRSEVSLEIDNRLCKKQVDDKEMSECFPDTDSAADYLAALNAVDMLHFPYPLTSVISKSCDQGGARHEVTGQNAL